MLCSAVAIFTEGSAVVLASRPSGLVPEAVSTQRSWVPSTVLFVPTAEMRVVAVCLGRAEDKVGRGVSSLGRGARRPSAEGLPKWSGACLLQMQW